MVSRNNRIVFLAMVVSLITLLGMPSLTNAYYPSNYIEDSYVDSEEIPVSSVYDIVQTEDGYIWIASYEGLVRYDGTQAHVYTEEDGFPSTVTRDLFIDSNGDLWIAANEGLILYKDEEFTTIDKESGLSDNMVRTIDEDSQGNIVAGTQGGISIISPDLEVENYTSDEMKEDYPRDIGIDSSDEIYIVTNDGDILQANTADIQGTINLVYSHLDGSARATSVYVTEEDTAYFGFSDGTVVQYNVGTEIKYSSELVSITNFYESDGKLFVCGDGGLGVFHNGKVETIEGISLDGSIECVFRDYEGNYWVGSSRDGLIKLVPNTYYNITEELGLSHLTVNSTAVYNNDLYIAADEGLWIMDGETKQITENDLTKLLEGVRIRNLCVNENELWISTYSANLGVIVLSPDGTYELINTTNSDLPSDDVRFTMPLQGNQFFVGTKNGAAILEGKEVVEVYDMSDGLENEFILSACQTSDGTIYVGTDGGGLYTISTTGELKKFENETDLNIDIVLRLETDPITDVVWLAGNSGLAYIDDEGMHPIAEITESEITTFDIKFYENEMWLLTSSGIYKFDRIAYQETGEFDLQRIGDTHFSVTPNSWSCIYENVLFISTTSGIFAVNLSDYYEDLSVPKIAVPTFNVDGEEIPVENGTVTIPSGAKRITVGVSMLSSAHNEGQTISIQLEGIDDEAVIVGDKYAEASYTNVPGGTYELVVTATSANGIESDPYSITVEKNKAFFEYTIVRVGILVSIIGAVVLITSLVQRKKHKARIKRAEELRMVTDQAISAITEALDAKDPYTHGHSKRVAEYSLEIGKRFGMSEHELESLYITGLLHDIGKIGVDTALLTKSGKLTEEEYHAIMSHTRVGGDILKKMTTVENIATAAMCHHERFDGKGYPQGLKGDETPLFGRIVCVADAFDAMTSTRCYRKALSKEVARDELIRCRGAQFDPEVADKMVEYINEVLLKKNLKN